MYLHVRILDEEGEALRQLAEKERRPLRQQAALLIRESLKRRGVLVETAVAANPQIEEEQDENYE